MFKDILIGNVILSNFYIISFESKIVKNNFKGPLFKQYWVCLISLKFFCFFFIGTNPKKYLITIVLRNSSKNYGYS